MGDFRPKMAKNHPYNGRMNREKVERRVATNPKRKFT
jgi:hypothetical protein